MLIPVVTSVLTASVQSIFTDIPAEEFYLLYSLYRLLRFSEVPMEQCKFFKSSVLFFLYFLIATEVVVKVKVSGPREIFFCLT